MFHTLKMTYVRNHNLTQRALRPVARFDQAGNFCTNGGIIQNAEVDIEQSVIFSIQLMAEIVCNRANINTHLIQRSFKSAQFGPPILHHFAGHGIQVGTRRHYNNGAYGYARRTGNTLNFSGDGLSTRKLFLHGASNSGVSNNTCQLGRHGDEEGLITLVVAPLFGLLHHQNTQHFSLVDYRHTQKCVILILSNLL